MATHAHFELVLGFGWSWNVTLPFKGGKVLALWAGLGAGVHAAEFQEVLVLNDVIVWQAV